MKAVGWMAGASAASAVLAVGVLGGSSAKPVLLGMAGPLVTACAAWLLMERTYRRNPQQLTGVMIGAFGGKVVFFGAYIVVVIRVLAVPAVPFIASFTGYFVALYVIEALLLKRLLAGERSL